jgi:hypothetical protein
MELIISEKRRPFIFRDPEDLEMKEFVILNHVGEPLAGILIENPEPTEDGYYMYKVLDMLGDSGVTSCITNRLPVSLVNTSFILEGLDETLYWIIHTTTKIPTVSRKYFG